jgi:hypothetical protein
MGTTRLTKVMMDEGSNLNILYASEGSNQGSGGAQPTEHRRDGQGSWRQRWLGWPSI